MTVAQAEYITGRTDLGQEVKDLRMPNGYMYPFGRLSLMTIKGNRKKTPWWYSVSGYALSAMLGLAFVYRMCVEHYVYDRVTWVRAKPRIVLYNRNNHQVG
jgi:hypothetical protein